LTELLKQDVQFVTVREQVWQIALHPEQTPETAIKPAVTQLK
jgi:hypothetical protein